ncbi:MAG: phosphoribosylformylglycinamidine cyclo-ligase [bacterium]|nr:phosphoribosylformylglycinamidine cyclo-ligase [bacterium]
MHNTKQSGFDIDLGDRCSANAFAWSKKTFSNRQNRAGMPCLDVDGAFSNMLDFKGAKIGISSDGIGTKIELAERTGIYHTLGYDLMAMVVDDLAAGGFEPGNISNILDVDFLDYDIIDRLMQGLHDAANETKVAISGGEIAELGNRICGYGKQMHFNWCSTAIGILHEKLERPIDGSAVQAGDAVIALQSRGFRSNGFSLLRKIVLEQFGEEWHNAEYDSTTSWGEALLTPSRLFAPAICGLLDADFQIEGIAHITGGGIESNFQRVLKVNTLGAVLNDLFAPLPVMQKVRELGGIDLEDAYRYWNMGNGMLFVAGADNASAIVDALGAMKYTSKVVGKIVAKPGVQLVF